MKKIVLFLSAVTLAVALPLGLNSCADKMTDQHSRLVGGNQGQPAGDSIHDYLHNGTPENSDGKGQPMAGGKVNSAADTMWNQSSPLEGNAF